MQMDLWALSPLQQLLLGFLLFVISGGIATAIEWLCPARLPGKTFKETYFGKDSLILLGVLGAGALIQVFQLELTGLLQQLDLLHLADEITNPVSILESFFLVFFVLDFFMYWLHRGLHSPRLWPIHRWHHSIESVNWLSGVRLSLTELLINSVPAYLMYLIRPQTLAWGVIYFFYTNILIHLNIKVRSLKMTRRIARWLVLPEYHRIHHASEASLYNYNFSIFWTFWDRIFGTYLDPQTFQNIFPLGLRPQNGNPNSGTIQEWKMAIGI